MREINTCAALVLGRLEPLRDAVSGEAFVGVAGESRLIVGVVAACTSYSYSARLHYGH